MNVVLIKIIDWNWMRFSKIIIILKDKYKTNEKN